MSDFKVGDKVVFPMAPAHWNRGRVYEVETVFNTGDLTVSAENGGGGIFYYWVSASEAEDMGMERVPQQ